MGLLPWFANKSCSNVFADFGSRQSLRVCRLTSCPSMGDSHERDSYTKIQESSKHLLEFPSSGLLPE